MTSQELRAIIENPKTSTVDLRKLAKEEFGYTSSMLNVGRVKLLNQLMVSLENMETHEIMRLLQEWQEILNSIE